MTGQEKREEVRKELWGLARQLKADIRAAVLGYKPMGVLGEWGEILGLKPKRGILISTPLGTIIFAKARRPKPEEVQQWEEWHREIDRLNKDAARLTLYTGNPRPNTVTGNLYALQESQRLQAEGLTDSAEDRNIAILARFWDDNPAAEYGIYRKEGVIEPVFKEKVV